MSKTSDLLLTLDEMITCGQNMVKAANALKAYFSSTEESDTPTAVTEKPVIENAEPAVAYTFADVRRAFSAKSHEGYTEQVKALITKFNLAVNEQLGHYAVPNSVSMDQMSDDYDLGLASVPSPEDEMVARETKQETRELFSDLIHHLIDRSPKHGLAALLLLNDVKGAEFHEKCILVMMRQTPSASSLLTS